MLSCAARGIDARRAVPRRSAPSLTTRARATSTPGVPQCDRRCRSSRRCERACMAPPPLQPENWATTNSDSSSGSSAAPADRSAVAECSAASALQRSRKHQCRPDHRRHHRRSAAGGGCADRPRFAPQPACDTARRSHAERVGPCAAAPMRDSTSGSTAARTRRKPHWVRAAGRHRPRRRRCRPIAVARAATATAVHLQRSTGSISISICKVGVLRLARSNASVSAAAMGSATRSRGAADRRPADRRTVRCPAR